jgi:hypothetical protein
MQRADNKLYIILICAALALAVLFAFEPIRHNQFINYDDYAYILDNQPVTNGLTRASVVWAFTDYVGYWHPLAWLSHMLDCEVFGLNPVGHHFTSLLIHIASVGLLFGVLKRMTGALWPSAFVAAVFAIHPLRVESVAWVTERKDVLSVFFWMLTMAAYIRYVQRPYIGRYLLVFLTFALGLMAKPTLVTLPFVLLLLDYWPLGRFRGGDFRRVKAWPKSEGDGLDCQEVSVYHLVLEKIPFFALSIVLICALVSTPHMVPTEFVPMKLRIANALVSYPRYIGKIIWPTNLVVFHTYPPTIAMWQSIGAALLSVCATVLVISVSKSKPYLCIGWLWYLGTLVPVLGLVQAGHWPAIADRFTYLPSIGFSIMVAWGINGLFSKWRYRKIGMGVLATIVLAGLFPLTRAQVKRWQNSRVLFSHAVEVSENNYVAHNCLGMALQTEGELDEAIRQFRRVLQIKPDHLEARTNLGAALLAQGKAHDAIRCFREALRIKSDSVNALNNLAWVMAAYPDKEFYNPAKAVRLAEKACRLTGFEHPESLDTLAVAYGAIGKFAEAVETGTKALNLAKSRNKQHLADEIGGHLELLRGGQSYFGTIGVQK